MDIDIDAAHDMTKCNTVTMIQNAITRESVDYVHVAVPCNTYSIARRPKIRSKVGITMVCDAHQ